MIVHTVPVGMALPALGAISAGMTRSVTGCIPTQSAGTINALRPVRAHSHGPRGNGAPGAPRQPASQASFAPTGVTTLGFLNTSTFPAITSMSPINAGAVHW